MIKTEPLSDNVWQINVEGQTLPTLQISDVHIDSIHCKRDILKSHMDEIVKAGGLIFIYGDLLDVMASYGDRRLRREYVDPQFIVKGRSYLDMVVEYAIKFLKPYSQNIAFISYGNHECYHPDTEVLTAGGWKNIKDVTQNDLVATFDESKIFYDNPTNTVSKKVESLYKLTGQHSCQYVSPKHRVVLNDMSVVNAEDIHSLKDKDLPYGMKLDSDVQFNDDIVRLITCVVMDGTIVDRSKYGNTDAKRIQFKISKPEKITYIRSVLDRLNVKYTFKKATKSKTNKLQPYYIRIYGDYARTIFDMVGSDKQLPEEFVNLSGSNFDAFIDALENTDAHRPNGNSISWSTTSKNELDLVQVMCIHNGWHCSTRYDDNRSGFGKGKRQYVAYISEDITKNKDVSIDKYEYSGLVYCLSMPNGRFITRYNGKVAYSGNCTIQKFHDTDPLRRIVYSLNQDDKTNIALGSYSGWVFLRFNVGRKAIIQKIHYHHGFGGNAKRSKGMLDVQIEAMKYPDADILVRGHTHQKWYDPSTTRMRVTQKGRIYKDKIKYIQSGSYVDGIADGKGGWAVEKNFVPTDIGGWFVDFSYYRYEKNGHDHEGIKSTVVETPVEEF